MSRTANETAAYVEADQLFLLMKRKYRISRNVRAQWYFHNLNQLVQVCKVDDNGDESDLAIIGALPEGHVNYKLTPNTLVTFLSKTYRLVFILDYSPSTAISDSDLNCVLQDNIFTSFKNFLIGIVQPFNIPSSSSGPFSPELFITVIAYTSFLRNRSRQVLVQGCAVNLKNFRMVLQEIEIDLQRFLRGVVEASAFAVDHMISQRKARAACENSTDTFIRQNRAAEFRTTLQIPSDSVLIDMVRFGMLAVQLLPEDTSAGMIFFTDGVLGVPDVTILDTLLTQLRIWTVGCTFILIQKQVSNPDCAFGKVSNIEFMRFLAKATFGAYLENCPNVGPHPTRKINMYHKAILCWNFQRALEMSQIDTDKCKLENCLFHFSPVRYKHYSSTLSTMLTSVLSVRLREGYTIKSCNVANDSIRVNLVLPWKNQVSMEYVIASDWPPVKQNSKVQIELWTEGPYDFLNDVLSPKQSYSSPFRAGVVASFFNCVQNLTQADKMLMIFESFRNNGIYYTVPDSVRNGMPLFYLLPDSDEPVISSKELQQKYASFCNFWRPICTLDMNIWQKWLHTHRITLLLTHDVPLSYHLHVPSLNTGRYGSISCRKAAAAVDTALKTWSTFSLLDTHSYVKFEYEPDSDIPAFFYVIRPSFRPPCVVVRLAFLGGIKGSIRHEIVSSLANHLLNVEICQRTNFDPKFMLRSNNNNEAVEGYTSTKSANSLRANTVKLPACVLTKKPIEKILVRYDKIPSKLSFMIQDEELNKSTALNNILCRYLHCKRWIWPLKHTVRGLFISTDTAALILNTLLRAKLNDNFRLAYGHDGVITMLKEYYVSEEGGVSSCIVQFVMYPPVSNVSTTIATLSNVSYCRHSSQTRHSTRESFCSENEYSEADSNDTTGRDIQLVTELWVEPQYGKIMTSSDEELCCEDLFFKSYDTDRVIIKTLATFEHLKLLKDENELRFYSKRVSVPGRTENDSAKSFSFTNHRKSSKGDDYYNPEVDQSVATLPSCFDLCLLLQHCQMAALLFSTLICVRDAEARKDDLSNYLFVEAMHHELKRTHDSNWILYKDRDVFKFWRLVLDRLSIAKLPFKLITSLKSRLGDSFDSQIHRLPQVVCYIKKISQYRLIIVVCPKSIEDIILMWTKINEYENDNAKKYVFETEQDGSMSFPILVFNCSQFKLSSILCGDEQCPESTFDFAQDYRNGSGFESVLGSFHRQISIVEVEEHEINKRRRLSSSVVSAKKCAGGEDEDDLNFSWYCSQLELLHCRAFVAAVYRALISDSYVNPTDVKLAVEGKCEETNVEIDLTEFLETVCDHYKEHLSENNHLLRRRGTVDTEDSVSSFKTNSIPETPPIFRTSACRGFCHNFVKASIAQILTCQFKQIKECEDFYYYCPPVQMDEPVSEGDSFSTISPDEQDPDPDQTISFASKEVESRSPATADVKLSFTRSDGTRETLRSLPDLSSSSSDMADEPLARAWRFPVFLNIGVSVRCGNEQLTCTVKQFPTCLAEIFRQCEFDSWDAELQNLNVTYDMLILTVGKEEILPSTCGEELTATPCLNSYDSEETFDIFNDSESTLVLRQVSNVPEPQRIMLENLKSEINLILQNEVLFAHYRNKMLNLTTVRRIIDQVRRLSDCQKDRINTDQLRYPIGSSNQRYPSGDSTINNNDIPSAHVENLPLNFVLRDKESLEEFRKELCKFKNDYFHLNVCYNGFYYAAADFGQYANFARKFQREKSMEGEAYSRESIEMRPDDMATPVAEIDRRMGAKRSDSILLTAGPHLIHHYDDSSAPSGDDRFLKRSHSFSGFSHVYYVERSQILKGKWASLSGGLTFDPRTLKRLALRSGGAGPTTMATTSMTINEKLLRYGVGAGSMDFGARKSLVQWKSTAFSDSFFGDKETVAEAGYDAESSAATGQDETSTYLPDTRQNSDLTKMSNEVPDFWLIVHLSDTSVTAYFYERLANTHRIAFSNFVDALKESIKVVNQKMLLQNLLETRRCNSLLVAEDISKFDTFNSGQTQTPEDDDFETDTSNLLGYLAASSKCAPNTFACPCVHFRWFIVHPRLKTGVGRIGFNRALLAMKSFLNKFIVHNRENLFVFKESETGSIFYLRLHDKPSTVQVDFSSLENGMGGNSKWKVKFNEPYKEIFRDNPVTPNAIEQRLASKLLAKEFTNKILVTVHGVCEPGDEIKNQLMNALENKLRDAVLDQVLTTMERNPNCKLMSEDVNFLQPKSTNPTHVWHFVLPSIAANHLHAVNYYIHQQMTEFLYQPNYAPKAEKFKVYNPNNVDDDEDNARMYLYFPRGPTRKGIAVISQNIVDVHSNRISFIHANTLNVTGGFSTFFQSGLTFDTLTEVQECCEEQQPQQSIIMTSSSPAMTMTSSSKIMTSPSPRMMTSSSAASSLERKQRKQQQQLGMNQVLVQLAVWESGIVAVDQLKDLVRTRLTASMCDLTTEYGLFTLATCVTTVDGTAASEPGSPIEKNVVESHFNLLRKRHSSAIMGSANRMHIFNFENIQQLVKRSEPPESTVDMARRRHKSQAGNVPSSTVYHQPPLSPSPRDHVTNHSITRLNPAFVSVAPQWFDFMAKIKCYSLGRTSFSMEMDFGQRNVLPDIYEALKHYLSPETDVSCYAETVSQLGISTFESVDPSIFASKSAYNKHKPISNLRKDQVRYDETKTYFVICQSSVLWKDTMHFSTASSPEPLPDSLSSLISSKNNNRLMQRFLPFCMEGAGYRGFIPRQRMMLVVFYQRQIIMFAYNWLTEVMMCVNRLLAKVIYWQNARAALLKRICLQKLGYFYNVNKSESATKTNPYMDPQWFEHEYFITNNSPPNQPLSSVKPLPDYHRTLLCGKINSKDNFWAELKSFQLNSIDLRHDPIAYHGTQILRLRETFKKQTDEDLLIRQIHKQWLHATPDQILVQPDASILRPMLNRSHLVHAVYTPLLFHPSWRLKVGQIRQPMSHKRRRDSMHTQRSRHSSGQVTTGHVRQQSTGGGAAGAGAAISPFSHQSGGGGGGGRSGSYGSGIDFWHVQLQSMIALQYSQYLANLGLIPLVKKPKRESTSDYGTGTPETPSFTENFEMFFQKVTPRGILIVRTFFEEPYFAIQFYVLYSLEFDYHYGGGQHQNIFGQQNLQTDELSKVCFRLTPLSHLHSFSYDFHLRMVALYASDDKHMVFKPGYNMQAFLSDFLRYYTCRPPYARTYIFEDQLVLSGLPVRNEQLYNYLLDHDKTYGLRVVRMRVPLNGSHDEWTSEYLLTSNDAFSLAVNQMTSLNYNVLNLLMRDDNDDFISACGRALNLSKDWLSLKFYIIFVEHENIFPVSLQSENFDSGKYERVKIPSWVIGERLSSDGAIQSRPVMHHFLRKPMDDALYQQLHLSSHSLAGSAEGRFYFDPKSVAALSALERSRNFSGGEALQRAYAGLAQLQGHVVDSQSQVHHVQSQPQAQGQQQQQHQALIRFDSPVFAESEAATISSDSTNGTDHGWRSTTDLPSSTHDEHNSNGNGNKRSKRRSTASVEDQQQQQQQQQQNVNNGGGNGNGNNGGGSGGNGTSVQAEAVTYLAFITDFESTIQQSLSQKTAELKTCLKAVAREAASHCRRDQLWRKLLIGVATDGSFARRREDPSGITYAEFHSLLQYVHCIPFDQLDPNIGNYLKLTFSGVRNLIRLSVLKYGDHCRKFISTDGSAEYLAILNSNYLDTLILVHGDARRDVNCAVKLVYKDYSVLERIESDTRSENKTYRHLTVEQFWQDFVNGIAFNIWSSLL